MARFTSKHMTVFWVDQSGVLSVEAGPTPGDLSIGNLAENNREVAVARDRGTIEGSVYTGELEQDVSLTLELRNQSLVSSTEHRLSNALLKKGSFSGAVTTDPGRQVYRLAWLVRLQDEAGNVDWIKLPAVRAVGAIAVAPETSTLTVSGSNIGAPLIGTAEVFP